MRSKKEIAAGVALFVAGGLTVWLCDHVILYKHPVTVDSQSLFGSPVEDENDPIARMQKMQERMEQSILQDQLGGNAQTFNTGGEISQREDEKFVYYDLELGDGELKEMQANVSGGQLQISARLESTEQVNGMQSSINSSFNRSFPVPPGVDAEKFRMNQEGKKLVISFPKVAQ